MEERFSARMFISWYATQRQITIDELGVAPTVVLSWSHTVVRLLAENLTAKLSQHWIYRKQYPLYAGELEGYRVSCVLAPIGAPGTVMIMEEMIASGARFLIGIGFAGSLQPAAPIGTLLIPTSCVSEEGTSVHYLDDRTALAPSPRLHQTFLSCCQAEGINILSGPLWTTDAPYRELVSKIELYRLQGVLGVDMETSAMYALGRVRNVEVCNLLIISDELWHEWQPAFGRPELKKAIQRACDITLRVVKDICSIIS